MWQYTVEVFQFYLIKAFMQCYTSFKQIIIFIQLFYNFSLPLHRESYMSAHVLLNLLNELGKRDKCEACRAFYLFFATSLINSIIQEHECYILFII